MAQVSKAEAILGEVVGLGERVSTLPLTHTDVQGQIVGLQATISLTQRFANPYRETIEVMYRFAIPHRAALAGFDIQVGKRTIVGEIAERDEAETLYRDALAEGRRAALATEERPNLYTVQIGQINPRETVEATYRYSLPVDLDGGEFSLVLPFGITPRYHSPAENPRDAARTEVAIAPPGAPIGDLDLTLAIDAGLAIADPTSPSHQIAVRRSDDRRCLVQLVEPRLPNQDFVLRYAAATTGAIASRAWWTTGEVGNLLYALFVPPPPDQSAESEPREYVFVLDRSGSMSGEPIAQARNALRACLRLLGGDDSFRILTFDNVVEWYKPSREEPQAFNSAALRAADHFLASVEGRGGTEILGALRAVADCPRDPRRRRVIVLFTDGAVSAEDEAARLVAARLAGDRFFCFGIGPAVNRYLLERLSRAGRGTSEVVGLDEDIEGAIIRFQDRLSYPVLSDLSLVADGTPVVEVLPSPLPDLYAGAALQIVARFAGSERPRITLRGRRGAEEVRLTVEAIPTEEPLVARFWARQRLDALLEAPNDLANRADIVALSRASGIVTPLTALLAVDKVAGDPTPTRRVVVASPLPPGVQDLYSSHPGVVASGYSAPPPPSPMSAPSASPGNPLKRLFAPPPRSIADGFANRSARRASSPPPPPSSAVPSAPPPAQREEDLAALLRALVREQDADGSWGRSVEETAAAVVAFARCGETPTRGSFRRPLERARRWLVANARRPEELLFRVWALAELGTPPLDADVPALLSAVGSPLAVALAARVQRLSGAGGPAAPANADYRAAAITGDLYSGTTNINSRAWAACYRAGLEGKS